MAVDILIKFPGVPLPELKPGQMRYVMAQDGVYLERRTTMFTTATRTNSSIPGLDEHRERCALACGKIPRVMIRAMLAFFRAAYDMHEGEAALVLLYHPRRRRFRWHCPEQTVEVYRHYGRWRAYDFIHYENPLELPPGYIVFGDAHSHGNWGPHPSSVDHRDEVFKDGLHIIVGNLCRVPEFHADFVMDGRRFTVSAEMIFEDTECRPFLRAPAAWVARICIKHRSQWN